MKKNLITFFILFLFMLMLYYPEVTKSAALNGLNLWFSCILPSLLPYTIISSLLLYLDAFSLPCNILKRIFKRKMPQNELLVVICGYMCGCPIGAKLCADLYCDNKLKKSTAQLLMNACNNLSPSFLINYLISCVYMSFWQLKDFDKFMLFTIMYGSSLLAALITAPHLKSAPSNDMYNIKKTPQLNHNSTNKEKKPSFPKFLEDTILSAFEIQAKICGYMILFTIVTYLLLHTLNLTYIQSASLGSLLEITSGLGVFSGIPDDILKSTYLYIPALISGFTTFGGFCTILQTHTVTSGSGLSIIKYTLSKALAGIFAFISTSLYLML